MRMSGGVGSGGEKPPLTRLELSPVHVELSLLARAVGKVRIDQVLIRNARLFRHLIEVFQSIDADADGYLLLQAIRIGIPSRLHLAEIVFLSHRYLPSG